MAAQPFSAGETQNRNSGIPSDVFSPDFQESIQRVLFLGYDKTRTVLISELENRGLTVQYSSAPLEPVNLDYDLVISYGYEFILSEDVLRKLGCPVINLHISYLPWNRGAHPNFWAHFDNTPSGVTIHLVDEGIDTGPILYQKFVHFDRDEQTFSDTYSRLHEEIQILFLQNLDEILSLGFVPKPQRGKGSVHRRADLPASLSSWNANIDTEIARLDLIQDSSVANKLAVIDKIEQVRSANNVNWMDLLRIVAKKSPDDLNKIASRIRESDHEIFDLFIELSE